MSHPYIELHLHLDGAVTVPIARRLAELQHIALPAGDDDALLNLLSVPANCQSLNDFLSCFALPLSLMQTREGLREAVRLVLEMLKRQGVIYAELRFAPQLHTSRELSQREAVEAALDGLQSASLPCNLILCCMRGEDNRDANIETVELAREFCISTHSGAGDFGVAALDLAGAEALYPTRNYESLFALARSYNIPFTIHAGEADGADSVRCAVRMGARRIGHGVRIAQDPALMDEIRERGIFLELCPTSNRQTKAVADMSHYPLKLFLERGLKVTLNTDDMAICRTTLPAEFRYARQELGISAEQERQLFFHALEGAFLSEDKKQQIRLQNFL